ncbi:MAG: CaiB/BaiF CoA transferase family protein [Achromobacter mucicolens]
MPKSGRPPLSGIRIVDFSRVIAGPMCTQILSDMGAEVIKIENPDGGDDTRKGAGPRAGGESHFFMTYNRGKKSVTLDFTKPDGQKIVRKLLEKADVVIQNFRPGVLKKYGLDYATLHQKYPKLIYLSISAYGQTGPLSDRPGYDPVLQAESGMMSVNGEANGEATRVGLPVVDMVTGLNAAVAILLALNERTRSGLGQFLDITLYDCALSLLHPHAPNYFYSGKVPQRSGNAHPNIAPYETLPTASGPIFLAVGNNRQFAMLTRTLDAPALSDDPRYATNADRLRNRQALRDDLAALLARHEAATLADQLLRAGVPAAAVQTVDQALAHPHTRHRGMVLEQGDYKGVGSPIKLSRTPATLRKLPPDLAPPSGQD